MTACAPAFRPPAFSPLCSPAARPPKHHPRPPKPRTRPPLHTQLPADGAEGGAAGGGGPGGRRRSVVLKALDKQVGSDLGQYGDLGQYLPPLIFYVFLLLILL